MRQLHYSVILLLSAAVSLLTQHSASGQGTVGIGLPFRTQAPNAKAVLHIEADPANPQGVLLPRLDRTRLVGLTTAENGMLLYDPSDNGFHYWLTDRWMPMNQALSRQAWISGTASPDDTKGRPGDFYYQTGTRDLYQKNDAGTYVRLFSLGGEQFWQGTSTTATHTLRNVGIGITDPTERLMVDGAVVATSLAGADIRVLITDATGRLLPIGTGTGYLANDGYGNLAWRNVAVFTAGNGIDIQNNVITNTGDTNLSDDITVNTAAGGDLRGFYPNPILATSSVTAAKIASNAVTTAKLADGSVTLNKIANSSVSLAKIQPSGTPNTFLSTNASGVVAWVPIGGNIPGAGEISVGNGIGVNQVPFSQDATLATNGSVTVKGLLGRPLDNLSPPVNGEVLTWDGSAWTPKPAVPATGTLEAQVYATPQTRYYSLDPTDFVETNTLTPHIILSTPEGSAAMPETNNPGYLAAPLHLPHKAVITEVTVHCFNDKSNTAIGASLVRNATDGTATIVALGATLATTGNETITLASLPEQVDNKTYSYKIVIAVTNPQHLVHGVRITYTVNFPD